MNKVKAWYVNTMPFFVPKIPKEMDPMTLTVADVARVMEMIAPASLAEGWDNVGLQVGAKDWPVRKIRVALDPAPKVVAEACREGVDLLITHHPLLFKPLKNIDFASDEGAVIQAACESRLSIFCAHTNYDSARGGLNDLFAERVGLKEVAPFTAKPPLAEAARCKLVFFVPTEYAKRVKEALFATEAGRIGEYSCCSFSSRGRGTFVPSEGAKPFSGNRGALAQSDEIRVEVIVERGQVGEVLSRIRPVHPYETMAYDIYPLLSCQDVPGIGRTGSLEKPMELERFAAEVKKRLGLPSLRLCGDRNLVVESAAVCTGSGAGLLKDFFSSGAQVYITGDMRYHDARAIEEAGLGLIDVGHFASEHLIVDALTQRLREHFLTEGVDVDVTGSELEREPFEVL